MSEERDDADLPPLREVIRACGLSARKSLGQNFLLDLNLTRRIARAAGPLEGVTIIEVGPGPGGLTRALLSEGARRVIAIERDERFRHALELISARYPGRLHVLYEDALAVDYEALTADTGATRLAANLPYNIATPLLTGWLTPEAWPPWYDRLVLMFQKEVAERIIAAPGDKAYGRLAVIAQARSRARMLFTVPARAFTPSPNVDSALVEIVPVKDATARPPISRLEAVTAAAFGQRRKMLRSSLQRLGVDIETLLACAEIDGTQRAENIPVEGFWRLAACLDQERGG